MPDTVVNIDKVEPTRKEQDELTHEEQDEQVGIISRFCVLCKKHPYKLATLAIAITGSIIVPLIIHFC